MEIFGMKSNNPQSIQNIEKKDNQAENKTLSTQQTTNTKKQIEATLKLLALLNIAKCIPDIKKSEKKEDIKPKKYPDDDDKKSDDKKDDGFDDGNDINPGFDGKTQVCLLLTVDGGITEIYRLSNGKYVWPVDYHFPHGRSLSEVSFNYDDIGIGYSYSGFSHPEEINYLRYTEDTDETAGSERTSRTDEPAQAEDTNKLAHDLYCDILHFTTLYNYSENEDVSLDVITDKLKSYLNLSLYDLKTNSQDILEIYNEFKYITQNKQETEYFEKNIEPLFKQIIKQINLSQEEDSNSINITEYIPEIIEEEDNYNNYGESYNHNYNENRNNYLTV